MSSPKPRRQLPLTEEAAQKIIAAAMLAPGEEPGFHEWLREADQRFLDQQSEIADDLTPKKIGSRLAKIARLSAELDGELQHPQVLRYLETDRVRAEAGDVSRERAWALAGELYKDIEAVERLRNRSSTAHAHITAPNPIDRDYFGKLPAEQPHVRDLICSAYDVWVNVLARPPRRTAAFVRFTQVVLAQVAQRSLSTATVHLQLKRLAPRRQATE